ncbi:MAG: hypothetical protein WBC17_04555 [Mycobacterium sp.]|jgi:hypothetical protein
MSAAPFIGRVAGITAALGMSVAILQGTAVAAAETDSADTSSRPSASASTSGSDSVAAPSRTPGASGTETSGTGASGSRAKPSVPVRGRTGAVVRHRADAFPDNPSASANRTPAVDAASVASPAVSTVPARAATTTTLVAPPLTPAAAIPEQSAEIFSPTPPVPTATVETRYGALGQWMINKEGQVADWIGQRYCGAGTTVATCGAGKADEGKIMQEPINTIFVVQARNQYFAELKLNLAMRLAGFGPSCCSSVGYSGIVGDSDYRQFPRGGPLGLGILPPLPFGLFQNGLLGLVGFGPAYRDRSFLVANTHLRTFGGAPDGNGNYIFTASVSEENLDSTGGGLLPTHGFLNYNQAREQLLAGMLSKSWIMKASDQGLIPMDNAIDPLNPEYTTGDHDGLAQVIALGSLWGMAPVRTTPVGAAGVPTRAARSLAMA